jgi:hypothetical protein
MSVSKVCYQQKTMWKRSEEAWTQDLELREKKCGNVFIRKRALEDKC